MENLNLEYKGYTSCMEYRMEHGRNRLYGKLWAPGASEPLENWGFAGDNMEEATQRFESMVDKIIEHENYKRKQKDWESHTDWLSIASVLNMLPDAFEKRIIDGTYDKALNIKVVGGDYEVPLYYVTKAWDLLLKGSLVLNLL